MSQNETQVLHKSIDAYVEGLYAPLDAALENALRRSREAGLPEITGLAFGVSESGCPGVPHSMASCNLRLRPVRPFRFSTYAVG